MSDQKKRATQMRRDLQTLGIAVEPQGNGHFKVTGKNGATYSLAGTPGDHRWYANAVADMKRAGIIEGDPRVLVQEAKRSKGGKTQAHKLDMPLLERRAVIRDRVVKVVMGFGPNPTVIAQKTTEMARWMVENKANGVPSSERAALTMLKAVDSATASATTLDLVERMIEVFEAEANDPLRCPECGFKATSPGGLGKHSYSKHGHKGEKTLRQEEGTFECLCGERYRSKSTLTRHLNRMEKEGQEGHGEAGPEPFEEPQDGPAAVTIHAEEAILVEDGERGVILPLDSAPEKIERTVEEVLAKIRAEKAERRSLILQLALLVDPDHADEALGLLEKLSE